MDEAREGKEKKQEGRGEAMEKKRGQRWRPLWSGGGWDAETDKEEGVKMIEGRAEKRGCVVTSTDSILETHHFTSLHHDGKCAAYIIKLEVNRCSTGVIFMCLCNANDKNTNI